MRAPNRNVREILDWTRPLMGKAWTRQKSSLHNRPWSITYKSGHYMTYLMFVVLSHTKASIILLKKY